jgi:hypothetical protein
MALRIAAMESAAGRLRAQRKPADLSCLTTDELELICDLNDRHGSLLHVPMRELVPMLTEPEREMVRGILVKLSVQADRVA